MKNQKIYSNSLEWGETMYYINTDFGEYVLYWIE